MITNIGMYSHSFFIQSRDFRLKAAIADFAEQFCEMKREIDPFTKVKTMVRGHEYFAHSKLSDNYGFLNSDYDALMSGLRRRGFNVDKFVVTKYKMYAPAPNHVKLHDWAAPKPKQIPAVEFALNPGRNITTLHADTGFGKTFAGIWCSIKLNVRTVLIMRPTHIATWITGIKKFTNAEDKDFLVPQGGDGIKALVQLAKDGLLDASYILLSADTLRGYIEACETTRDGWERYGVPIHEFWELIKPGLVLRDEVHEALPQVVKQSIYTWVPEVINMSATLVDKNPFIITQYARVFPIRHRWESEPNKHVINCSVFYGKYPGTTPKFRGPMGYSQHTYEKFLMKRKGSLNRYLDLIVYSMADWRSNFQPGRKLVIIASSKKMIRLIRDRLRAEHPDLIVEEYIAGSPDKNLYDSDITVTTPGSGGTGKDIPGLSDLILTVGMDSAKLYRQVSGRLREADYDVRFFYLVNRDIPQHMKYDEGRAHTLKGRSKAVIRHTSPLYV